MFVALEPRTYCEKVLSRPLRFAGLFGNRFGVFADSDCLYDRLFVQQFDQIEHGLGRLHFKALAKRLFSPGCL